MTALDLLLGLGDTGSDMEQKRRLGNYNKISTLVDSQLHDTVYHLGRNGGIVVGEEGVDIELAQLDELEAFNHREKLAGRLLQPHIAERTAVVEEGHLVGELHIGRDLLQHLDDEVRKVVHSVYKAGAETELGAVGKERGEVAFDISRAAATTGYDIGAGGVGLHESEAELLGPGNIAVAKKSLSATGNFFRIIARNAHSFQKIYHFLSCFDRKLIN